MHINEQIIQHCRNTIHDKNSTPQQVYNALCPVRKSLCQKQYGLEIGLIMQKNLHIDIFNFTNQLLLFIHDFQNGPDKGYIQILEECLWIFTNLCMDQSGKTQELASIGVIQISLKTLTMTAYPQIIQCTLQLIGNLVGENSLQIKLAYLKSPVFANFYLNQAYKFWNYKHKSDQTITWTLCNVFRGITSLTDKVLANQIVAFYFPVISNMLCLPPNKEQSHTNLHYALFYSSTQWTFAYQWIHQMIGPRFQKASHHQKRVMIETYGNMAAQSEYGVKVIIENEQIMGFILNTLKNKNGNNGNINGEKRIMKNCAWILSNILAGTQQQIDYLIMNNSTFFNEIYQIFEANQKFTVLKQLIWAISNMLHSCSLNAFQMLFSSNILTCLSQKISKLLIQKPDTKLAQVYLQGIQNYIQKHNKFPQKFALQVNQKIMMLKALKQIYDLFVSNNYIHNNKQVRLHNAIAYLQSIITVGQMNAIAL